MLNRLSGDKIRVFLFLNSPLSLKLHYRYLQSVKCLVCSVVCSEIHERAAPPSPKPCRQIILVHRVPPEAANASSEETQLRNNHPEI